MRHMSLGVFGAQWRLHVANSSSRWARAIARRWTFIYGLIGILWVVLSDELVRVWLDGGATAARVQQLKGLAFVAVTGGLLYAAVFETARRMQAQHKLAQRQHGELVMVESRWRHLMRQLDAVAWFSSLDGAELHYVSTATERVYGRPPEDFLRQPGLWKQLVHPDDLPAVERSLEAMRQRGSRAVEYRIRHTDGRWRWVRDRGSVLFDRQRVPVGLGGIIEDITDRLQEQTALRQREVQLADIVDTALDAIITVDAFQHIVVFNRAAERVFRTEARAAIGVPVQRFIPEPLPQAHRAQREGEAQAAGRPGKRQLQGVRADGESFVFEGTISRLDTERGPVMTVVLRDAGSLSEAEAARDAQAAAEEASRAKTEFLSRMSHELRTPLNAVLGFSQLLQGGGEGPLTDGQREQVDYIHKAGWHLLALINDVLDVSMIEAGQMQVQAEWVPLDPLLHEVVRMCAEIARKHGVTVRLPAEDAACSVCCDRTRLRQVLLNLLSNAIKYNHLGGQVELRVTRGHGEICLGIDDTGIGMTAEQQRHLFEPFNRLGRERSTVEGTGIGLTLTRELVHLMKGRLEMESEPGIGTRVRVYLAEPAGRPAEPRPAPAPYEARPVDDAVKGLVLYIEDNPVNALVVQELLVALPGVRLEVADDGATGIQQVEALKPDLVLLDMRLPDMVGEDVLHALRSRPATRDVPVVALSASAMPEDVSSAMQAGAEAYWTKPIDFKRFVGDIQRLLCERPGRVPALDAATTPSPERPAPAGGRAPG